MSKIIVLEGTDCSGKETQTKLLEASLKEKGIKCIRLSFPVYNSPTGRVVGQAYLGKPEMGPSFFKEGPVKVDPYISSLYYAADRKYNIDKLKEYIDNDYVIILDRYTTSNMAHQGSKIEDKDERFNMYQWIDKLEFWLLKLPKPDITIFLHLPVKYSYKLKENRKFCDGLETDEEYQKKTEKAYIELSELYNWKKIECIKDDAIRNKEDIHEEIMNIIMKYKKN